MRNENESLHLNRRGRDVFSLQFIEQPDVLLLQLFTFYQGHIKVFVGKSSSEDYAIFVLKTFLRKIESKYEFLKVIYVEPATKIGEIYHIKIAGNIDGISETDARRAIQQLLETISQTLGENINNEFIQNFKNTLDKKYLMKLEDIGVNFHMIELHESMMINMK